MSTRRAQRKVCSHNDKSRAFERRKATKMMHSNKTLPFNLMIFFLSLGMFNGHAYKICINLLLHLAEFA